MVYHQYYPMYRTGFLKPKMVDTQRVTWIITAMTVLVPLISQCGGVLMHGQTTEKDPNSCFWFMGPKYTKRQRMTWSVTSTRILGSSIDSRHRKNTSIVKRDQPEDIDKILHILTSRRKESPSEWAREQKSRSTVRICRTNELSRSDRVYRCCHGFFKDATATLRDNCTECPDGFFGWNCGSHCECENGGTCDKSYGLCQCAAQYFGEKCQYPCNCENGGSCQNDGSCLCLKGFRGRICEQECSCPSDRRCDSVSGGCVCYPGYYGGGCEPCTCLNGGECDPKSGFCTCKPGYYGKHCENTCNCYNGATCAGNNDCKCGNGWTGNSCTTCDTDRKTKSGRYFCDGKCIHCYNGNDCSVESGNCECTPGWQGGKCDQKCREGYFGHNCVNPCRCKHGECSHVNGNCNCENGWTSQHCNIACPMTCVVCEVDYCESCKPGYIGTLCDRESGSSRQLIPVNGSLLGDLRNDDKVGRTPLPNVQTFPGVSEASKTETTHLSNTQKQDKQSSAGCTMVPSWILTFFIHYILVPCLEMTKYSVFMFK